jgi:hypothetical protein
MYCDVGSFTSGGSGDKNYFLESSTRGVTVNIPRYPRTKNAALESTTYAPNTHSRLPYDCSEVAAALTRNGEYSPVKSRQGYVKVVSLFPYPKGGAKRQG